MKKCVVPCAVSAISVWFIGCSGLGVIKSNGGGVGTAAEAPKFDAAAYQANKQDTVKKYTTTSNEDVLNESKKVIVPDFKVYFDIQARGAAETGHALSGLGGGRREARVSQKVKLAVEPAVFQKITDGLYKDFIAGVKAMGYEVIEQKELAEKFPEYAKYIAGDSMKASPHVIDEAIAAYAPTGMKIEQPGFDLGMNQTSGAFAAFGTTLQDVSIRASQKLDAIRMQPVYVVGFAEIRSEGNVNRAELQTVQSIRVGTQTQIRIGEGWTMGYFRLDKAVASFDEYGKFVSADSLTDKTRGVMSALGSALKLGGNSNDSSTTVISADSAKYTAAVQNELKIANELLFARMAMEKK